MKKIKSIKILRLKNILLQVWIFLLPQFLFGQVCNTDSNYYSTSYHESYNLFVKNALRTTQNEMVVLSQNDLNNYFVSKFTPQGNVLWSNEYLPDYPHTTWFQYPWYSDTKWTGMSSGKDSGFYVYGSAIEHGALINNAESPAPHLVGLLMNIDKFGNVITGKYFGNWGTDYSIEQVFYLNDGNLIVFLRSHFEPFKSKIICINNAGDIIWGTPLQLWRMYIEESSVSPKITQLANGNIAVMSQVMRTVADTIVYPFQTIIIPGPLQFLNFLIIDYKTGNIVSHTSFESPALTGSNVPGQFVMGAKSITALPNGDISLCADMYIPIDRAIFYNQKVFSKRAVNFIADKYGFFKNLVTYSINGNQPCSLENVTQTGNGEQTLLIKDSASKQLTLVAIDAEGQIKWTKSYTNPLSTPNSMGIALKKSNSNSYSIFQSDSTGAAKFNLIVTNTAGNTGCEPAPQAAIIANNIPWPWPADKVVYMTSFIDIDFRYSPFKLLNKAHPLLENTDCKYQFECCKNVIDTVHLKQISLCSNETYTLPDSTVIRDSGTYYATLKKQDGCDSIVFYHAQLLKSPEGLKVTSDTCMMGASSLTLYASGGFSSYTWNNISTPDSSFEIHKPGNYTVSVKNTCGTFTDTIHILDQCDYPIYFPNAFTPNLDNLNDLLRVPPANKNRLIRLRVYNQWGQLVFSTTQHEDGWNGTYKGQPQPIGLYVYILEMRGLTGNKLTQRGTVTLLR